MAMITRDTRCSAAVLVFVAALISSVSPSLRASARDRAVDTAAGGATDSVSASAEFGLTSGDLSAIGQVSRVAVAPNGVDVAWTTIAPRLVTKDGRDRPYHQIWVKRAGKAARKLVDAQGSIRGLRWTHSGQALSYLRAQRGGRVLVSIRAEGSKERVLMRFAEGISSYSWAHDGKHIAFTARQPAPRRTQRRRGYRVAVDLHPGPNVGLFVARVASAGKAHGRARRVAVSGSCSAPRFRPDGGAIAVAVAPDSSLDRYVSSREIQIVTFDGAKPTRIAVVGKLLDLRWSPDGKRLAFIAGSAKNDPAPSRLYVAQAPKWRAKPVKLRRKGHVRVVRWVSSTRVVASLARGLKSVVAVFDVRSGRVVKPWPLGPLVVGDLAIASRDATKGTLKAAVVASTPSHPNEVYWIAAGGHRQRVSQTNPHLHNRPMATQRVVHWRGADGVKVEGVLLHPLVKPKGPGPLIVALHGGPAKHVSQNWVSTYAAPGQVFAARGYYVLYPNYRGSTGRGLLFSSLPYRGRDGAEFDDVLTGVKHLVSKGLVDADKVGVIGASYGGYMAAWAATRLTKHFAAAIMLMGVSDQVSKWGTTDVPTSQAASYIGKRPWQQLDRLRNLSPISWIERARTPLLIAHGSRDQRIDPGQSKMLYRYLKAADKVPCRLVIYEGEGHGLSRRVSQHDFIERQLRWFDRYLTGKSKDRRRAVPPRHLPDRLLDEAAKRTR